MKPLDRQIDNLKNAYYPDEDSIPEPKNDPERSQDELDYRYMTKQERRAAYKLWRKNR